MHTLFIFGRNTRGVFERNETDNDCSYCHNLSDISQSQHRIVRVSKGSNKKSSAIKLFQFWDLKTQRRFIFQEEVNISKRELSSFVDSLRDFLETQKRRASVYKIYNRNRNMRLDLQIQKRISLLIIIDISLKIQMEHFVYRSNL